ncbi:MAG: LacI family DNA-binding transcriptional regulator [Capsulimonadaceae bacterium]|nr:LacI family DNA-binding transcriptional regulator [Capsulimonadaceae bacterium]
MSITEIASRAGVSKSTVSLVINNRPSIPQATAERVRQAMRDLNYTPAPVGARQGRRLKSPKSYRIGLIADMPVAHLRSPVFVDAVHAVEAAARSNNCTMMIVNSSTPEDQRRLYGTVDGLILMGNMRHREALGQLAHLPCVALFGDPSGLAWCDRLLPDNVAIGALAARRLVACGHTHAAMLTRGSDSFWGIRHAAFRAGMEQAGGDVLSLDAEASVKIRADEQYADTEIIGRLMDELLAANPRPSGLFLPADLFAPAVYFMLLERGIRLGADIEIVTCNNEQSLLNALRPRPVSVDIHSREIGRGAVDRLIWRINHPDLPRVVIAVQPDLSLPSP